MLKLIKENNFIKYTKIKIDNIYTYKNHSEKLLYVMNKLRMCETR